MLGSDFSASAILPPPPPTSSEASFGGAASLNNVSSARFENLFQLKATVDESSQVATESTADYNDVSLMNVSGIESTPLLVWENFLQPEEVDFLVKLVYSSDDASAFGTQFLQEDAEGAEASNAESNCSSEEEDEASAASDDDDDDDDDGSDMELSPEIAAMVAAALSAKSSSGGGRKSSSVTKNRLRTSHFFRTVWWRSGQGRAVYEALVARAAHALGLPPSCAEAPQMVCYPGGATYFRCHHDSGRLSSADPTAAVSSSRPGADAPEQPQEEEEAEATKVELHRDHYGAARVASVRGID
jgi:hypothetical protein